MMETFDIVQKNMHSHGVNKFSGVTLWHDLTTTAKVGTVQQNCNVTGEVNLRVKAKGFRQKVMQRNNMSVLGWFNKKTCQKFWCILS